jgi:cell fate regulator YaaT (PSP1 superfamily)
MAKDQNLSLNSAKISGTCGRLLCCLRYEDEVYQKEYERTPKVDAIVETPEGKGTVVEANPLKGIVRVRLDDRADAVPQAFHRDSVKILGYHKKNNDEQVDSEILKLEE